MVASGGQSLEELSPNFLLSGNLIKSERLLTELFLFCFFSLHKRTNDAAPKPEKTCQRPAFARKVSGAVWER